jgi:membrane protease YdiL (CAAX protease family)
VTATAKRAGHPLVELGLGAAWLTGLAAVLSILDRVIGPASLGTALFGAIAVDMAAERAGVRWSDGVPGPATQRLTVQRLGAGAGAALVAWGLSLAPAAALGWFHADGARPSPALVLAVLRAAALGVRDELLFRGIPLTAAARAGVPATAAQVFAALVSGAAVVMVPGATPAAVALAVASGWLFAAVWRRDRGAWAAVGAHAAWSLLVGPVLHGGLLDVDWTTGELAVGASAAGPPAWVAAGVLIAVGAALRWVPWPGPKDPA